MDKWLATEQGILLCAEYSRAEVVAVMRTHLARIRRKLENGGGELPELGSREYTALLRADLLERRRGSLRRVINATGIVIHTNLGRAPLAAEAIEAMQEAASGYSNLEYDLTAVSRGSRNRHAEELLCALTGAEAALVVNNCAAAVLLGLRVIAGGGEVVVSRGELIEIGGSFRMPDVIAESGATMIEVGTTNRTTLHDYAAAVTANTRALLASHPSNYRIVGFVAQATLKELEALARERGLVLIQDLGSGSLVRLEGSALAAEPAVAESVASGVDLVTFSGDKLLGGPQAGIVVGRADLVARLKRHPMARAVRIDKLSLAALTATLRLYLPPNDPKQKIPVLKMATADRTALGRRAARFVKRLAALDNLQARIVDDVGYAGGGSLPMSELPTRAIRLEVRGMSAAELAARLRAATPPIIARISKDYVTLDLRTVLPNETAELAAAIRHALS